MPERGSVRVAVAAATYWLDRPYEYLLPDKLRESAAPGKRVVVPFGNGNRRCEGIILSLQDEPSTDRQLKYVDSILDAESVLSAGMLSLALWMHSRFFCTVYEAVRAMLPAGLWYALEAVYTLAEGMDREAAYAAAGKSAQEQLVLDAVFAHGGCCPLDDLRGAFVNAENGG